MRRGERKKVGERKKDEGDNKLGKETCHKNKDAKESKKGMKGEVMMQRNRKTWKGGNGTERENVSRKANKSKWK